MDKQCGTSKADTPRQYGVEVVDSRLLGGGHMHYRAWTSSAWPKDVRAGAWSHGRGRAAVGLRSGA